MKTMKTGTLAAALLLAVVAISCDRDRSNPLDPQADFAQDRPSTPAQLAAEAGVGVIRLAWSTVEDRDLAGYAVFRAETSNGSYAFVAGDGDSAAGITTGKVVFVDTMRSTGLTWFYRVAAVDTVGRQSQLSPFVGATALEDNVAPEPPQSLSAVPDEEVLGRAVLRWSAPQKDSDGRDLSGLSGYIVLRAEAGTGGVVPIDTVAAGVREYVDSGLKTLTTYSYSLVAFDEAGNASRSATATQVTTPGLPVPQSLNAADEIGRIVVTWDAVDDEALIGYDVLRSERSDDGYVRLGAEADAFTTGRTAYIDSGLAGGQVYFYRVRAVGRGDAASELSTFVSGEAQADEVPPAAPGNLAAVPDAADFGRVTVSWNVPQVDVDGGILTGLNGYTVYRSEETQDSFVRVAAVTEPRYEDSGLEESSTYYYTVVAFDDAGNESGRAAAVRVRTQGEDRVGPDAPQNVSAVADETTTDRITVRWSAPTTDADGEELTGLDGFVVFRSEGGPGAFVPVDTVDAAARRYDDTGLKSLTVYAYTVVAFDAAGNESRSATSSQTSTGGIAAPTGLTAADEIGRIVVSWQPVSDSDLAGYNVYRSTRSDAGYERLAGSEGTDFTTGRSAYVDSNLAGGSLFYYKVEAVGLTGLLSERSAFVGGRAQADEAAPGTPRNISAVADENDPGRITVGWSAPSTDADGGDLTGLDGFVLLRAEGTEGAFLTVDTLAAEARTHIDTGLKALTDYRYAVVAFDASGNQSAQAVSSTTRTAGIPTPTGLRVSDGIGRITVTWQAVDADALLGYEVYRSDRSDGNYTLMDGEGVDFTTGRTAYVDSNLAGGSLYFYKVRAIGAGGLSSELSAFVGGEAAADESAPGAPQNVSAVPSDTDPGAISVRWTAPTTDANGGTRTGLSGFRLLRAEGAGSLVPVATLDADVRQYDDSGLRSLTTYRYALIAFDAAGNESATSSSSSAQTIGVSVPQGLAAADGIGRVDLNWQAVDDDELIGYNVYRSTRPDLAFTRLDGDGGTAFTTGRTSFVDSTVSAGQLLYYKVSAVTGQLESERSAFVSGTADVDDVAPATPADLVAIADDAQARISLSWTGPRTDQGGGSLTGLAGYIVFRGKDSASSLAAVDTVTGTSFDDASLTAATTYYYAVSAIDGGGNVSPRSSTVSATTQGIGTAGNVAVVGDIRSITISWSASGEDALRGYNVYRSTRSDQGYTRLTGNEGTSFTTGQTSYIDSNLAGGAVYFYRVSVVTDGGESDLSPFGGATVQNDTRAPEAPTFLDGEPVTGDPERITLTWRAPNSDSNGQALTGVSQYRIYRSDTSTGDFEQIATSTTTAYDDTLLAQRTTYYYQVEAMDDAGNVSPRSSTAAATTSGVDQPSNVRLVSTTPSTVTESPVVTISWTRSAGAILHYEVERTTVEGSTNDADYTAVLPEAIATTRTDDGVTRGTTYYYRVRAVDVEQRESDWTELLSITVSN